MLYSRKTFQIHSFSNKSSLIPTRGPAKIIKKFSGNFVAQTLCLFNVLPRFVVFCFKAISSPPTDVSLGILWIYLKGLIEISDGLIVLLSTTINSSSSFVSCGILWVYLKRFVK